MVTGCFSKEELKNLTCIDCANKSICAIEEAVPLHCLRFSPTKEALYKELNELHKKNKECAKLFGNKYEENHA